jgi:hypothetical protein
MVEMKLVAEVILVVIAAALIIWYVVVNFQSISTAFNSWIVNLKDSLGIPSG